MESKRLLRQFMFFEKGKKFIKSFSEIKNKKMRSVCHTEIQLMMFCLKAILQMYM